MVKPYSPREVVARVRAVLRRSQPAAPTSGILHVGDLTVDPAAFEARCGGAVLDLTVAELRLLAALAQAAGAVRSRAELLFALGGLERGTDERTGGRPRQEPAAQARPLRRVAGHGARRRLPAEKLMARRPDAARRRQRLEQWFTDEQAARWQQQRLRQGKRRNVGLRGRLTRVFALLALFAVVLTSVLTVGAAVRTINKIAPELGLSGLPALPRAFDFQRGDVQMGGDLGPSQPAGNRRCAALARDRPGGGGRAAPQRPDGSTDQLRGRPSSRRRLSPARSPGPSRGWPTRRCGWKRASGACNCRCRAAVTRCATSP